MDVLETQVRYLKGIGDKKAQAFKKLGVETLRDLVSFFPRAYEDRSVYKPIALLMEGETACCRAMAATEPRLSRVRRGLEFVKFRAVDDSGSLDITFFNMPYVKDNIKLGETYIFYGKAGHSGQKRTMTNPVYEPEGREGGVTGRIVPVYRLTQGISQRLVMSAVREALDKCRDCLPDPLPDPVRERYKLCQSAYAYEAVHFPPDFISLDIARRRLVFEEFFVLACALKLLRSSERDTAGIRLAAKDISEFYRALPFEPTNAQRRAVEEACSDMASGHTMNRLLQGDVGSGKTLVAAALMWCAFKNGCQSAFMAPTEILAEQHMSTLTGFLSPFGVRIMKLTGSLTAKEKRQVKEALKTGECDLVVGTHALLTSDVEFNSLALVITDEQHRFGVHQRSTLTSKGLKPHVLVMSATPIPRTLALIMYGELELSILDELPPGRQKVDTFAVPGSYRPRLNGFIRKLVGEGRQVFVVCPMIEENEDIPLDLKPAQTHAEELRREFPELRVACIHGKQKAKDKDAAMAAFVSGDTDILVSTTVIEVGVDVPNAALMIVENAERFGLSQLHQLRGRVGRGQYKSYCVLVSDAENEEARARLSAMTHTSDGFKISEEDLRLRGPGDFFGSRQHGLPEMHVADLGADMNVLSDAQNAAQELLERDPCLSQPGHAALRESAERLMAAAGGSFN